MFKVGDKVMYLPHQCHAIQKDKDGNYPWVFGLKSIVHKPKMGGGMEAKEEVRELDADELESVFHQLKISPRPDEAVKNIVLLRPCESWPAVVTAVNEDGSADLDIMSNNGGVTLHYKSVRLYGNNVKAHSFLKPDEVQTKKHRIAHETLLDNANLTAIKEG